MKYIFILSILFTGFSVQANALKIFTYEKSINSENIMVVHTNTNEECLPLLDPTTRQPSLDFYWLMGRKTFKPVNGMIKKNIRERISATSIPNKSNVFYINLNDLSEVNIDLPRSQLIVETFRNAKGQCDALGTVTLGASDENVTLALQRIFAEVKKTINPLRPKVKSITLEGIDLKTGSQKVRTYLAK